MVLGLGAAVMALIGFMATPASAISIDQEVVEALDRDGRYLESSDAALEAAVDDANRNGIAFVSYARGGDITNAENLADEYVLALEQIGSSYHTVLVLTLDAYAAFSTAYSDSEVDRALEASFSSFSSGSASRGVDTFNASLEGTAVGEQTTSATTIPAQTTNEESGGIGFGTILMILAVLGGGFLLFRSWSGNRRAKRQAAIDLEEDRIEIEEQLKNNADRVISLGDRAIASGDAGLVDLYEEASQTYQDVSLLIDETDTAEGIDELDDRIDKAEWQFEVIEARLDGRPVPPEPQYGEPIGPEDKPASGQVPPPPTAGGAPGQQDRSVITSPTTGREYQRPSQSRNRTPRRAPTRRRSGGMGGLGGVLGGVLGNIILGGGLGGGSRRTQRRTGGLGIPSLGGGTRRTPSSTGGLGGGVLRRGGGSTPRRSTTRRRSRPQRRSSSTRGGGRSLGNRQGGGRGL